MKGSRPGFHCLPPGSNKTDEAEVFSSIEEAGAFLRANPSWGIRMRAVPSGPRDYSNLIVRNISIDGILR